MPEALKRLIHSIGYLPGIGEKSATKLAFFLLNANKQYIEALTENLKNIHEKVTPCPVCFSLCDTGRSLCNICNNSSRDHTAICIVEEYLDMMTIEDSGGYTGVYHVLG
ncbi:MAG: recombination protein RecR [Candidatus Peribacteria bacterium]|nr:MAG: recombination protein RecR [Candidatus Peribacteria bacterium]